MTSVLILTKNEEENLPTLLKSLHGWTDDVVVLDSGSTDRTVDVAKDFGARVYKRTWETGKEHDQRNYGLHEVTYRNEWLYIADADELLTNELKQEIDAVIAAQPQHVGYWVRYRNMFSGKWIKHSSMYPTWVLRLVKPVQVSYPPRGVNMHAVPISGSTGRLHSHFIHFSFNKGMAHWLDKHNAYSDAEAVETLKQLDSGAIPWRSLLSTNTIARRSALKSLSFRLPFRPLVKFVYMYFVRAGFLDGRAGLVYCVLQSFYEFMITLKVEELKAQTFLGEQPEN